MSERDKFIADIIAELSRQKEANKGSLEALPKIGEIDVFRKLCFSYPMVVAEDVQDLSLSIDKIAKRQPNPIVDSFCLDENFIENLQQLSDQVEGGSLRKATQTIAAIVFLKFPKFLLSCNKRQLTGLFSNFNHSADSSSTLRWQAPETWSDIIKAFRSLIFKCSSSYVSELTLTTFSEGFHLVSLLSAVSTLDKMVQLCEGSVVSESEEEEALKEIEDSQDAELLTLEAVFHRLIKEVITSAPAVPPATEIDSTIPIVTHSITSSLKEMWLHLIFIYRDILIRIPALVPAYLPPLCEVLVNATPSASSAGPTASAANSAEAMASLFDFSSKSKTGSQYPTSSECMFAMILSNVSSSLTTQYLHSQYSDHNNNRGRGCEESALSTARGAMRDYLTTKQRLTVLVDIWERMNAKPKGLLMGKKDSKTKDATSDQTTLNVEAANFLLDVGMLYACDLSSGSYTYASSGGGQKTVVPSAKHFEFLISSRLLPCLLGVLVTVIHYSVESSDVLSGSISSPSIRISSGGTAAVSSLSTGLLKFLCLSVIHSPSIGKYVLEYPDLHAQLAQVAAKSWGGPVEDLKTSSDGALTSIRRNAVSGVLDLFSPADAVGFLMSLLLNSLAAPTSLSQLEVLLQVCEVLEKGLVLIKVETTLQAQTMAVASISDTNSESEYVVVSRKIPADSEDFIATTTATDETESEEVSEKTLDAASNRKDLIHVTAVVNKLSWMLSVMLSNKDGLSLIRGLFKTIVVSSTESALLLRLQQVFKSFIDNTLLTVTSQMKSLPMEPIVDTEAVAPNESKILTAHECLKKQLKALQVMSQGFTSNKTD